MVDKVVVTTVMSVDGGEFMNISKHSKLQLMGAESIRVKKGVKFESYRNKAVLKAYNSKIKFI